MPNRRVLRIAAGERLAVVALRPYPDTSVVEKSCSRLLTPRLPSIGHLRNFPLDTPAPRSILISS